MPLASRESSRAMAIHTGCLGWWVSDTLFLVPCILLPFLCSLPLAESCLFSSLCSVCCFLHPYLKRGSWGRLMMMKDTCKKQSARLHQEQRHYLGHSGDRSPLHRSPPFCRERPRLCGRNPLEKRTQHHHGNVHRELRTT